MLGCSTAYLEPSPRRLIQRVWGTPDITGRQKWWLCWPTLRRLPTTGLRLLDAGCGSGVWALEISARRRDWTVVGLDRVASSVEEAEQGRRKLKLDNLRFVKSDFLEYEPEEPFDIILSVASAHYLAESGQGAPLFLRFHSWLKPGGLLLLLGPRRKGKVPIFPWLSSPILRNVFSRASLEELCGRHQFEIRSLEGCIGRLGTLAHQLSISGWRSSTIRVGTYPLQLGLMWLDRLWTAGLANRSLMWRLVATAS
jgi:SAM-dependent methyltransferase